MDDDNLPYYKINKLLWQWQLCDGAKGCRPVNGVALSMDKTAPPIVASPKPVELPPKPCQIVKMVDDVEKIAGAFPRSRH